MAHDDGCSLEGTDGLLKDILRRHVEMVRRLVEDQQVHGLQQQAYHGQAAPLAPAEHLHLLVTLLAAKHESAKDIIDAQTHLTLCHVVDGLEDGEVLVE